MTPLPSTALSDLPPGAAGEVLCVDANPTLRTRLEDLGLVAGSRVVVRRRAPLGDPTEYELRGYRLCLRRTEAGCVRVRLATGADVATSTSIDDELRVQGEPVRG